MRRSNSSNEVGAEKFGTHRAALAHLPGPSSSISQAAPARQRQALLTGLARGSVAIARKAGPLQQPALIHQLLKAVLAVEEVVNAVLLTGRGARVVAETDNHSSGWR